MSFDIMRYRKSTSLHFLFINMMVCLQFEQMLGLAQRSQDELFHIALYNWLIQADLTDKLLEVGHALCLRKP